MIYPQPPFIDNTEVKDAMNEPVAHGVGLAVNAPTTVPRVERSPASWFMVRTHHVSKVELRRVCTEVDLCPATLLRFMWPAFDAERRTNKQNESIPHDPFRMGITA